MVGRTGSCPDAGAFEKNEIDFEALPHVTESMLEKIGVPVGPRAKLLTAIAALAPNSILSSKGDDKAIGAQPRSERRQITAMFCDLVDLMDLAGRLDPEEFGSVMQAFQESLGRPGKVMEVTYRNIGATRWRSISAGLRRTKMLASARYAQLLT